MAETQQKVVEKNYIEVTASAKKRFLLGLVGGIGWGIGLTLGTAAILVVLGFFVSKIDFVPILGQLSADVIKEAQINLRIR